MQLAGKIEIAGVSPATGNQPMVFLARDRLADPELAWRFHSCLTLTLCSHNGGRGDPSWSACVLDSFAAVGPSAKSLRHVGVGEERVGVDLFLQQFVGERPRLRGGPDTPGLGERGAISITPTRFYTACHIGVLRERIEVVGFGDAGEILVRAGQPIVEAAQAGAQIPACRARIFLNPVLTGADNHEIIVRHAVVLVGEETNRRFALFGKCGIENVGIGNAETP